MLRIWLTLCLALSPLPVWAQWEKRKSNCGVLVERNPR